MKGGLYLALRQLVSVGLSVLSIFGDCASARHDQLRHFGQCARNFLLYYLDRQAGPACVFDSAARLARRCARAGAGLLELDELMGLGWHCWMLAPAIGQWTQEPAVADLVRSLPLPIAVDFAASVSIAMLERRLAFAEVGLIEIVAQVTNYLVALPLVIYGWSYWGPIVGLGIRGVAMLVGAQYLYRVALRWRLRWDFFATCVALWPHLFVVSLGHFTAIADDSGSNNANCWARGRWVGEHCDSFGRAAFDATDGGAPNVY